jgi:hypothetical protein
MKLRHRLAALLMVVCFVAIGCSSPKETSITGSVTLDGQPLPSATVNFHPKDKLADTAATARTDQEGKFTLRRKAKAPLAPGNYVVTVQKLVDKKGNVPNDEDYGQLQAAGQLVNKLPARYSDVGARNLTVKVEADTKSLPPIELSSKTDGKSDGKGDSKKGDGKGK